MGRYKPYPKYKDSGVEWLGDVPQHWEVNTFKRLFRIRKRIAGALGFDVLSITQKGIRVKNLESGVGQLSMDYSKYQMVFPGEFAMNHMDLLTGFVDVAVQKGVTSPDYRVFSLEHTRSNSRYFLHLLQHCYHAKVFYPLGQGAAQLGRWRLPTQAFNGFLAPTPPVEEQIQIAAFLDYETAKIDALIAKQQELIALLKEKRQATISHAVTKGLNPDAPMRDSGVEWLGEVPAHWEVKRLKYTSTLQSGIAKGRDFLGIATINVPMLRVANVQDGYLDLTSIHTIEIESSLLKRYLLKYGDVLMNEGGDNDKLGRGAIWHAEIDPCIHQNHVFAIRPDSVEPEWVDIVTRASYSKFYFYMVAKQSTNLASISSTNLKEVPLTVPPAKERLSIMRYVSETCGVIDEIQIKGESQISLLQERRTALISAAVTGKIDVRDWQPPTWSPTTHEEAHA